MTSRDFYRVIDQALRPALEPLGFARLKTASSVWVKPFDNLFVALQVEKGVKNPYIKPLGGKFNVRLHLVKSPDTTEMHSATSVSFLRYQSDDDLAEMKRIRQKILRKILSQNIFESEFDKSSLEAAKPLMELGFEHYPNRRQPWPLEYLDIEDVAEWGKFIARKVAAAFDGISKEGNSALMYK